MPRIEIKPTEGQLKNFLRDLQHVLDKHAAVVSFDCVEYEDMFSSDHRFTVQFKLEVHEGDRYPTYTDEVKICNGAELEPCQLLKVGK